MYFYLKCTGALKLSPQFWEAFTYTQYILYFGLHRGCDWVCSSWQQTSRQTSLSDAVTLGLSHRSHPLNHHTAVQKNPRNTTWDVFSIWLEACLSLHITAWSLSLLLSGCSPAWSPAESTTSACGLLELWIRLRADILWLLMMSSAEREVAALMESARWRSTMKPAENWTFLKCVSTVFSACCNVLLWGWARERKKKMTYIRSLTWSLDHFNTEEGPVKSLFGNMSLRYIL